MRAVRNTESGISVVELPSPTGEGGPRPPPEDTK